jgi:hypothetical protein
VDNETSETCDAQITRDLERLAALDPALTADLVEHLRRAGTAARERLFGDPAPTQATPAALPDPPPAPFEYSEDEVRDRADRAARFRGQRRPIYEGSPWAG